MPSDSLTIADPILILLAWSAGLALVAAAMSLSGIVGRGFAWLAGGTASAVSLPGALGDDAWWARAGLVLVVGGLAWASARRVGGVMFLLGGCLLVIEAALIGGWIPAVTATLALGGVSGEMMLGHWYLIDPRLPRSALRALAIAGIVGLASEAILNAGMGIGVSGGAIGFWVLVLTSGGLMAAVLAAIRYPAYSGVMAATGLSYLAVLTTLGAVFVGRATLAGLGPFAS